jgi:hypothetical protein
MRFFKLGVSAFVAMNLITSQVFADENSKAIRIETSMFSMGDATFAKLQLANSFKIGNALPLETIGAAKFQEVLRQGMDSLDTSILTSPKIMTVPGQTGHIQIGQERPFTTRLSVECRDNKVVYIPQTENHQIGLGLSFTPELSNDNRTISLQVHFDRKELESEDVPLYPVTTFISATASMPREPMLATPATVVSDQDGKVGESLVPFTQFIQRPKFQTLTYESKLTAQDKKPILVYLGKQKRNRKTEYGPPILSQIPYLNRLFKNQYIYSETEHCCMLVTATIETEPSKTPAILPRAQVVPPQPIALLSSTQPSHAPEIINSIQYGTQAPAWTAPLMPQAIQLDHVPMIAMAPVPAEPAIVPVQYSVPVPASCPTLAPTASKHAAILKILLEQYHAACRDGDTSKAKTIAAHCIELDPTCFTKK